MTKAQQVEQAAAIEKLREYLKPGDTVATVLRHVSRSGMMRHISVLMNEPEGGMNDITYLVARALDEKRADNGGIKCGGCGMDMGFHLVYNLGWKLWPEGYSCPGEKCRSNDHANGDRNYEPHPHRDGGYALRQRWI